MRWFAMVVDQHAEFDSMGRALLLLVLLAGCTPGRRVVVEDGSPELAEATAEALERLPEGCFTSLKVSPDQDYFRGLWPPAGVTTVQVGRVVRSKPAGKARVGLRSCRVIVDDERYNGGDTDHDTLVLLVMHELTHCLGHLDHDERGLMGAADGELVDMDDPFTPSLERFYEGVCEP